MFGNQLGHFIRHAFLNQIAEVVLAENYCSRFRSAFQDEAKAIPSIIPFRMLISFLFSEFANFNLKRSYRSGRWTNP